MKKPLIALLLSFSVSALAEVTYEQLLQDPDNIELNQQYIREQLAAGELSQALVSIERVILLKPLDMDARLARAQVLFRLGNMTSAQQELEALDQLPLGERLEEQVDQLLSEVIARQQRWSFEGNVSIGLGYDDNIGGTTDTGERANILGEISSFKPGDAEDIKSQRSDYDGTISGNLRVGYDLGNQNQDRVFATIRGIQTRGEDSEIKNSQNFGLSLGLNFNRAPYSSEIYIDWSAIRRNDIQQLSNDDPQPKKPQDNINAYTVGIKSTRTIGTNSITASLSHSIANYFGKENSNRNDSSSTNLGLSHFRMLDEKVAAIGTLGAEFKSAEKPDEDLAKATQNRDTLSIGGSIIWQPVAGHRLTLGAQLKKLNYKDRLVIEGANEIETSDQFVRDDTQTTYSLSYTLFGAVVDPSL